MRLPSVINRVYRACSRVVAGPKAENFRCSRRRSAQFMLTAVSVTARVSDAPQEQPLTLREQMNYEVGDRSMSSLWESSENR